MKIKMESSFESLCYHTSPESGVLPKFVVEKKCPETGIRTKSYVVANPKNCNVKLSDGVGGSQPALHSAMSASSAVATLGGVSVEDKNMGAFDNPFVVEKYRSGMHNAEAPPSSSANVSTSAANANGTTPSGGATPSGAAASGSNTPQFFAQGQRYNVAGANGSQQTGPNGFNIPQLNMPQFKFQPPTVGAAGSISNVGGAQSQNALMAQAYQQQYSQWAAQGPLAGGGYLHGNYVTPSGLTIFNPGTCEPEKPLPLEFKQVLYQLNKKHR